jgi:hypothetical protein
MTLAMAVLMIVVIYQISHIITATFSLANGTVCTLRATCDTGDAGEGCVARERELSCSDV